MQNCTIILITPFILQEVLNQNSQTTVLSNVSSPNYYQMLVFIWSIVEISYR